MTFISYAQNFEDVLLWRALNHVQNGFYIDVGAAHPDTDSVTRAFYDRGWNGINIEPVEDHFRRLLAARPRDINLQIALSDTSGKARFFVVPGTGLSTLDAGSRPSANTVGIESQTVTITIETLAEICRQYAPTDIHFLKIDVEGAERAVLTGADFQAFRPWIVVVEATAPMSTRQTHAEWEDILLRAQYRFVWFDGLNRFYIVAEHFNVISHHFQAPPNIFDDFLRANDTEWARRINQSETERAFWRERAQEARQLLAQESAALGDARQQLAQAQQQGAAEAAQSRQLLTNIAALHGSTSWRVTEPLRRFSGLFRRSYAPVEMPVATPAAPPQAAASAPEPAPLPPIPLAPPPAAFNGLLSRIVHQFHSGSAYGDAITNAMLLTRRVLRDLGYISDIFVEHRDAALEDELRLIDELPLHADYVLIVRHSMGFDAFPRIAALPARKILLYHNITPPEFLDGAPVLQHYARLGRQQLVLWPRRVAAALADSDYNAIELRALGFDAVQSCMLLFDAAALSASTQQNRQAPPGEPFTLLFVGRVCQSKAQDALLAAFAVLRSQTAVPLRLVLVGRCAEDDPYVQELHDQINAHHLQDQVVLTGLVSDSALRDWYGRADLYVSLSHHEGFGVPLIEAIAHHVPVLAWPAGAVAYTLDNPAWHLAARTPQAVAAHIQDLVMNPEQRAALAQAQHAILDRFQLHHQLPALRRALALAGAALPEDAEIRAIYAAHLRITITGHVNGAYSLAAVNRHLALALEQAEPGSVRVVAVEGQPSTDFTAVPADSYAAIFLLAARPRPITGPHIVISQHYPLYLPEDVGDLLLAMFFWEESIVPRPTIALLNQHFRAVLAPSAFVAKALTDSGLEIPVRVVGLAADLGRFGGRPKDPAPAARPFTFLHVSSCFPRKGVDILLAAYAAAFTDGQDVRLVIKGFPNPHHDLPAQVATWRTAHPSAGEIIVINRDIDDTQLQALYHEADSMVLPTRGEGFNLPAAEAIAAKLPLIVTGFGGQMDFCTPDNARLVDYRFAVSTTHLATGNSLWVEPDPDDLAAALREAYEARGHAAPATAEDAASDIITRFSAEALARRVRDASLDLLLMPARPKLRLAWISSWDVRCGVAEYSRYLLDNFTATESRSSVVVLADDRSVPAPSGRRRVRVAWRLGDRRSLRDLAIAISAEDPDAVVIQHQPGLFGWNILAELLTALHGRVVVLTLHNTNDLADVPMAERQAVLAAMSRIARVLVHTLADINRLKALGLVANVTMLPHGAPAPLPVRPPRILPLESAPLIGCYGFFLPGKGIAPLIAAVARLRARWPGIRLRLVNAAYGNTESAAEIDACHEVARLAGLDNATEFLTGFLPHAESLAALAECDAIALPYTYSREASSAALRTALAGGPPVLVTPLPLFDEAGNAVARCAGTDDAAIAEGLAALLADLDQRIALQQAAQGWLATHQWTDIAARMQGMLMGVTADIGVPVPRL